MQYSAVILAGGKGARAGGYKPLWPLGGQVVIDWVVQSALTVCSNIRIVGGFYFESLQDHVEATHGHVMLLRNETPDRGMFSSVCVGLANLDGPVFIHPADIPGADGGVYRVMAAEFEQHAKAAAHSQVQVIRPLFNGRPGHPILLAPSAIQVVQQADPTTTLRDVLVSLHKVDVPVKNRWILKDMNTKAQYEHLKRHFGL
ncbi:MAG: NTP transferase domain-containing protein [Myxococcota bacterium]|nr:NTP transferase domain-containing protein [Myxococcota bacterium]